MPGLAAGLAVAVAVAIGYSRFTERPPVVADGEPAAAQTVWIRRMDLNTSVTVPGTVGHGASVPLTGRKPGTLTWLPKTGSVVRRGQRLYAVNARPVPLLIGATPLYRTMRAGVAPGPDVRELIENLRALGYGDAGTGDRFGPATKAAVKRWQHANGLKETGTVGAGDAVMLPQPVRIDARKAQLGSPATGELFAYTSIRKMITLQLDPAQTTAPTLKAGAKVTVLIPGGGRTPGKVTRVTDSAADDSGAGDGGPPKQKATVTVPDQSAIATVNGSVDIKITAEARRGVLAVPVTALLALAEGGYALQVADGTAKRLVGVRTGLFADGMVEVSGTGLAEGMRVVIAS